ncbi:thiamine biosynthesis protein ApbE [Taibaiella sp. KBW10]|uniref:FAD:protein FMN transferase n=1 Tax=Taibaiella sp. KBW10 TaxID=2153357 RepID=UPI000F59AE3D|nr:FAD:protein FMN transferase [Taibaiella sp. KBW10]RQO32284.1 thiamine biosynthesis protein ApbE [Taibaiella sp. KBW10]
MKLQAYHKSIASMTSHLDVTIVYEAGKEAVVEQLMEAAYAEANRLINIISAWQEGTELYAVNQQAGIQAVKVCDELFYLIKRSLKISEWTKGLFDITFASIDKVWFFDKPMNALPTKEAVAASVRHIDYRFIELNEADKTIFIRNKGTKIELGAIGKGFIANKMKSRLQALGIHNGMVNAGGDLTAWGKSESGETWRISIADPEQKRDFIAWLPIQDSGIATSGSYERYALIEGKKYSHIIHPKTGMPVKGLLSVTVISPDIELCDALATALFLLGIEEGLAFINQFNDLQCFIVDEQQVYHYSDNLKQVYFNA